LEEVKPAEEAGEKRKHSEVVLRREEKKQYLTLFLGFSTHEYDTMLSLICIVQ
jgi:hypothetical protein